MQMLNLSIYAWFTIAVIVFKTVMTFRGKMSGDILALIIISALLLTGTLSDEEALSSFSARTVFVVGVLIVLGASLVHAGVVHWLSGKLGSPKTLKRAISNLMLSVAAMSAIFNSNATTALFINVVKEWSKKIKIPASKAPAFKAGKANLRYKKKRHKP